MHRFSEGYKYLLIYLTEVLLILVIVVKTALKQENIIPPALGLREKIGVIKVAQFFGFILIQLL